MNKLNKKSFNEKPKNISKKLLRKDPSCAKFEKQSARFHLSHNSILEQKHETYNKQHELLTNFRPKPLSPSSSLESFKSDERITDDIDEGESDQSDSSSNYDILIAAKRNFVETVDLTKLINEKVRHRKDNSVIYLTYTLPKSSELFTPYSLIEASYNDIDKTQYYTVSRHGVTFWSENENYFTKLDVWLFEYARYKDLMKIKLFQNFRKWKQFKVWQKAIQRQKIADVKAYLEENLITAMPELAKVLLTIKSRLYDMENLKFVEIKHIEKWHLFYFIESQMAVFEKTRALLQQFRADTKPILFHGCYKAMIAKNFSPIDEAELYPTLKKLKEMMSFIDRAQKRRFCILLTNFLSYCDYLTITCFNNIISNTFKDLVRVTILHTECAPSDEQILTNLKLDEPLENPRPDGYPQSPFMKAELVLKPKSVEVDPSRTVTLNIMKQFIDLIMSAVYDLTRFQSDLFYKQFTEPSIMGKQEEKLGGPPPDLDFIINIDQEYVDNRSNILKLINDSYDKVEIYVKRFEPIRENYDIDLATEPSAITSEKDVQVLRKFCERYVTEMEDLEGILPTIDLGLIKLAQGTFKEEIIPVCRNLLSILDHHLPVLAIEKIIYVNEKLNDVMTKITTIPENTLEFVNYLRYIDQCFTVIAKYEENLKYAYDLLILMKDFKTNIDDEEKEKYLDTEEFLNVVKDTIQGKLDQRPTFVSALADSLQKDIQIILEEADDVALKSSEPWLLLENSDKNAVKEQLQTLYDRLATCQALAQDYKKYQKEFKIDVSRFDKLDHTFAEVKNRQLLWNSVDEWHETLQDWYSMNFHELNIEDLANGNTKIIKNCTLLEKYLPENTIVPKLRKSAEDFKAKLPTIGYLRNPTLKTRHWLRIEQILNKKIITDENLTMQTFEDIHAFRDDLSNELMEVAGQASAEAGLEALLKKVERSWKDFELSIVNHRDAKDVYILAGLEELQVNLDESNININTIAASRNVGPIKSRVDEWVKNLEVFGETLDEWIACQQTWIYLEAIFSAPDIQRQLPNEAKMFLIVDKSWKEIMRQAYKTPQAITMMTEPGLCDKFRANNILLEQIMRCLEAYLEIKRVAFPRFYFLSNDELLEILAQTRNPHAVQPHLRKCFDAINRLEFGSIKNRDGGPDIFTNDILAMSSPEGESILFGIGLKARGSVEDWLSKVEEAMVIALRRCMKFSYQVYSTKDRSIWFQEHPNQIVLTVSQQKWAADVHTILEDNDQRKVLQNMIAFESKLIKDLTKLASIARTDISKLLRKILCALITIDVHARDTITNLVQLKITKSTDFNWLKMLRYYWVPVTETMEAKMASANLPYFYEYLGAGGVLVITPLTDRCYLCLMGALQMDLGGAPAGPAGTGKTETTKDLAKALAKQCVVFNCSDGLDYKMMGRFFSGLAQSGAWCCFDEFNRIDIEVLSVIAQQLITIRAAKAMRQKRFLFEGREIKLNMSCAAFITMNPGYAGRTELPDNLKALFRPMAMMVPDYALIAEVILFSEGFENSKVLSQKMVQMYKLCSEQLSQQDHYDFGMRAVKSVLVMAGALKRAAPDQNEDITLIAALRDSNIPKFLTDDAKLFKGILSDLFPSMELPVTDYGILQETIELVMRENNLQPVPELVTKTLQLHETMCVRWGVMLVGLTGSGKTSVLNTLARGLSRLEQDSVPGQYYRNVRIQTLNPKSVTLDELYGAVNLSTMEWKDGLLGLAVRSAVNVEHEEHQWVVCDGPVDAVWIENMNTVLDDNKMLCLANSERIKLTNWVHLIFEVQDLNQASPATVSRCGMVYVDPGELGWIPLVQSWIVSLPEKTISSELNKFLYDLYLEHLDKILIFTRKNCSHSIHQVEVSKISMSFTIINVLIEEAETLNDMEGIKSKIFIQKLFVWSIMWSIGGNFLEDSKEKFEKYIRDIFKDINFPETSLWNYRLNTTTLDWEDWATLVPTFKFNIETPYFDLLVQTVDTVKFGYISNLLFKQKKAVMFTGDTGVGKSILASAILERIAQEDFIPITLNFSAQTNSKRTQEAMEARMEKRKKTLLGAPIGKMLIYFIDDVNMPELDQYGSQSTIELLRQLLDFHGLFDREKFFWKNIVDVVLGAACAPPGGGRNPLTPRFVRHFALLQLPLPSNNTLYKIFSSIINGFFNDFNAAIRPLSEPIVNAAITIYNRIADELLPTPTKSHYVFNLRDLSKCVQGILQADSSNYSTKTHVLRLFYHESMRVFHDRLINVEDKAYFKNLMEQTCITFFEDPIIKQDEVLMYGDFMVLGQAREDRIYEEIKEMEKLKSILIDYLDDYNGIAGTEMNLILFEDAVEHILRLARLLRAERGNGLLVGLSGMGKQSLSRLSSHINGYKCSNIELCRGYDHSNFHEDLRKLYWTTGVLNIRSVFLITDTQIVKEEFLEDINNILNSGEVPNLYESDELEKVIIAARDSCAKTRNKDCSRDDIFNFFISRVRSNLHLIICMSPVSNAFRRRCRMFPSLVNCCTIDWFVKWPREALYSVAFGALTSFISEEEQCRSIAKICVTMHESVEDASLQYYKEAKRNYYTTPSSYLELLKLYQSLLQKRADIIAAKRTRLANGLSKILESNELVVVMGAELKKLQPVLEEKTEAMKELLVKLDKDTQGADVVRKNVSKDESEAKVKKDETLLISEDAAKDLEIAMPALRAAQEALKSVNKNDINELRSFVVPPKLVQFVMEPVCLLLGAKPNWQSAKTLLANTNFLQRLVEFDKEHISDKTLQNLKVYVEDKDFDPVKVERVSKVCKSICLWVKAIDEFAKVYKVVEPKIKRYEEAESQLKKIMEILKQKQSELAEIEAKIQSLKDMIDIKNNEFQVLQNNVNLTSSRLNRAGRLTSALSDEEVRWKNSIEHLSNDLFAIPGDTLVASGCIAYLGAFSIVYRKRLYEKWADECRKFNIPSSPIFNFVDILGDPYEIRSWNIFGLPRDEVSIDNGIIVMKALRWPLIIDPQEQANRWIRNMEKDKNLRIIKMTDPNLMKILEICIRQGFSLLIEELGETVDPSLGPILNRNIVSKAGRLIVKIGENEIDYDTNFKLFMTTKLSNPHYLPEICIQVTLVNFLVTTSGLEDQLLAEVVAIELPELEKQRSDLIVRINADRQQLLALEDKVLKLLFSSEGNILDDEELVETLNEAKETSAIIAARLIDTEATEKIITSKREKYRPLAIRGANLFFVVASLADIDPMYQNSLKYYTQIFCLVIQTNQELMSLEERLQFLMKAETYSIYQNISRGLFEKHKLIFGFLLAVALSKENNEMTSNEFEFLLRGPLDVGTVISAKPLLGLSNYQWKCCFLLERTFENFSGICNDIDKILKVELGDFKLSTSFTQTHTPCEHNWTAKLTMFQKLIFINVLRSEKLVNAVSSFVRATLGRQFTEVAQTALATLYEEISPITPLVFILSSGSDPMAALLKFSESLNFKEKLFSISLGQGQAPAATSLIEKGRIHGHWVFLQNCHLAVSWMPAMEKIIRDIALGVIPVHADFRLYLSSVPTKSFPASVLQTSLKLTNEPPKGLRANLMRSLNDIDRDYFENHILQQTWKKMVFGVCMFHGILLERRKFGPLGWNIMYDFTESDRECGLKVLETFCARDQPDQEIPWQSLEYINGEVTWGGRVTDYWDQRCLRTILKTFHSPRILTENYTYSPSGIYKCPDLPKLEDYIAYIAKLPFSDDPEIFGMHDNANIVFESNETKFFIETILDTLSSSNSGDDSGKSPDKICLIMIENISKSIATKIVIDDMLPTLMELDKKGRVPSLTTVLLQEIERYNNLLAIVHSSLIDLKKAIKGLIVMSENLEAIYTTFLNNQIPKLWAQRGFLSTKTLANWVIDFQYRIDYIQTWVVQGLPRSNWISGLYFPQSFLTGTLQTHSRRYNLPIDSLKIDFEVRPEIIIQKDIYEKHLKGVLESTELYHSLDYPKVGVNIHGLFIEGGRWDDREGGLCDSRFGELYSILPVLWLKPGTTQETSGRYDTPAYKTQIRAGVLSTTGHSTNFVLNILLKTKQNPDYWILRGTALFTMITE